MKTIIAAIIGASATLGATVLSIYYSNRSKSKKLKNKIKSIEGSYDYICIQKSGNKSHRHGGTCIIEIIKDVEGLIEWKLKGKRKWKEEDNSPRQFFDKPFPWETDRGIIFENNEFIFTYGILVDDRNLFGFSKGNIDFTADKFFIKEFNGNYYQQSGNEIVWGIVEMIRI
jgi:hypothetical protein